MPIDLKVMWKELLSLKKITFVVFMSPWIRYMQLFFSKVNI